MLFKSWDKIVEEHEELDNLIKKHWSLSCVHVKAHNSKMTPLKNEEMKLRKALLQSTERERKDIEARIDSLVDEMKPLEKILNEIHLEEEETKEAIFKYIRKELTPKEQKKARQHGWNF